MRVALLALVLLTASAQAQDTATYTVTFDATWSATTHPDGFPGDPHFSPVVGAVHGSGARLWQAGELASPGMEDMAETGRTGLLVGEAEALVSTGSVREAVTGGWIPTSPGSVTLTVQVTREHPLVTLVSMLAPSPDWFVGTESLDLRDGDGWAEEVSVALTVWDAGTDSGADYTSPNADTDPAEPIALIQDAPFVVGGTLTPVGTMTFARSVPASGEETPGRADGLAVAPNPVRESARVEVSIPGSAASLALYDVRGRRVRDLRLAPAAGGTREARLETNGLAPGVYVLRLVADSEVTARRIVVAR